MNEYARLISAKTLLHCATTPLLRGQTRLCSMLRHLDYLGRHVSVQCDDTLALCYDTSVTWADTSLFSTVPYLRVPIVLSLSFIVTGLYIQTFL